MAWASENQGSVGTTPVKLTLTTPTVIGRVTIIRQGGSVSEYYLGSSSSVSSSTGLKITQPFFTIDVLAGDDLYAVTASGTVTLHTDQET